MNFHGANVQARIHHDVIQFECVFIGLLHKKMVSLFFFMIRSGKRIAMMMLGQIPRIRSG